MSGAIIIGLLVMNIFGTGLIGEDYSDLEKSIAVLHFQNLSNDEEQAWFSVGTTDIVIDQLSKISEFRVLGRTSTLKYKTGEKSISEIGEELGVNFIIEGSVQRADDNVRIIIQLLRVRNEDHMWSEVYDRPWGDIFSIQEEIALDVANELSIALSPDEKEQITVIPTENLEAYDLYLQGRYYWNQRTKAGLEKSIESFEEAIRLDNKYALAYAGLADAYLICGDWNYMNTDSALRKARILAHKAIYIDNTVAEAYATLAGVSNHLEYDYELSEVFFRQSLELNPNYVAANYWYALYLTRMGRFKEAKKNMAKALEIEPNSAIINYVTGWMSYYHEDYEFALNQMENTYRINPDFPGITFNTFQCYLQMGQVEDAILFFDERIRGSEFLEYIGQTEFKNDNEYLELVINFLIDYQSQEEIPYLNYIALMYTHLGEPDKALDILEIMVKEKATDYMFIKVEPAFKSLHSEPRFKELLKKINM